mgnify:CR=1 FL=1
MGFNSHFLVKNRFGVFYFQKRVPNCYLIKSLLDDETSSDSRLLETAANYHESIQIEKGVNPYLDEIQRLRTILGSTNGSNSTVNSVPLDEAFNEFISHHKTSWREDGTMESSY